MKSKVVAITLLASTTMIGYSSTSFANTCYEVSGSVYTENVTSSLQIGNMSLTLSDNSGPVFTETGSLVGNITGATGPATTILSHKARFPQGDSFVTEGDVAQLTGILDVDADYVPCASSVYEKLTNIAKGTRFFKNVTSVDVTAIGSVSNCPNLNQNSFQLSGTLCVE